MYCRRLGGLVGIGCGFSWKCYRNLDESAAKSGVVVRCGSWILTGSYGKLFDRDLF